jgi:hypothetical protein
LGVLDEVSKKICLSISDVDFKENGNKNYFKPGKGF